MERSLWVRVVGLMAATIIVTGCGGQTGNPVPQAATASAKAHRGSGSWMLPEATSEALIYAAGGCGGICVLSYPKGKQVGALIGVGAAGMCSDAQGNVFLTGGNTVIEYAHGGTTPVATLTLPSDESWGCSVDSTTNSLAVVYGGYAVAVFANEAGTPTSYSSLLEAAYCGYDNAGNLFVSGYHYQGHAISELVKGQQSFMILSVNGKLGAPGQIQRDGAEMTYENKTNTTPFGISQLSISGSAVTVAGFTLLRGHMTYAGQSWIYKGSVLLPYGKKDNNVNKIGIWPYPKGGGVKKAIKFTNADFEAVTVSKAPNH